MIDKIFNELAATSSRLEKEAILTENKNNAVLRWACFLALDPFTNFYIRKIPKYKTGIGPYTSLQQALDSLFSLSSRKVTGNAAIEFLTKLLEELEPEDARVVERVIEKDLRCGVSEATVNKIWPNLVPTYPCMLASAYEDKLVNRITYPAIAQVKLDGMRFNAIVKDGSVEFRSRNGKLLNLLGYLEGDFLSLAKGRNVVFDGELCVVNNDITGAPFMPRQIGNGILSKAQKGTLKDSEADLVRATVWDIIPYEDFIRGYCSTIYGDRFNELVGLLEGDGTVTRVAEAQFKLVNSLEEAQEMFNEMLQFGEEGIILKDPMGPWEDKRAKHQVKFKGELECDLVCVDWVEGTGKNAGRLGALVLESSDGKIKVNVGTGFTDHHRDTIGRDVVGKVISIKYNGRIVDQRTGVSSLFLPVFIEVRNDKSEADHSDNIK